MIYCVQVLKITTLNFKSSPPPHTHTHIHTSLGAGVVVKTLDDRSALVLMQSPLQYAGNSLGEWTFGDYQCWAHLAARRGFDKITHVCTTLDINVMVL